MEEAKNLTKTTKCLHCGTEFEQKHTGLFEHKYCSKKCRSDYHNNKRSEELKELKNTIQNATDTAAIGFRYGNDNRQRDYSSTFNERIASTANFEYYNLLQSCQDAKINAIEFKLRCEDLERRYKALEHDNSILKTRLEIYESEEEEEEEEPDYIGQIMNNETVKQLLPIVLSRLSKD